MTVPSPPRVPDIQLTTPRPPYVQPGPSYQAPGYYEPTSTKTYNNLKPPITSGYHTDVGAVIKVIDGGGSTFKGGGERFPKSKTKSFLTWPRPIQILEDRPTARPSPVIDSYGAPVTPLLDSYGSPVTRPYNEDDLLGVIIAKNNPDTQTVIGIKTPKINDKKPTYFDVVTPSPLPFKRPKVIIHFSNLRSRARRPPLTYSKTNASNYLLMINS